MKDIGRIVFAIPFAIFGLLHFLMAGNMAGMVPSWVPGGVFWVYLTGLALIAAGVAIITKKQIYLASILLAVLLVVFILTVHLPSMSNDPYALVNILKDLSLAGGALLIAGLYKDNK